PNLRSPRKQIEFWKGDDVIRVKVSEKHLRHVNRIDPHSRHASCAASTTVEQQLLASRHNQRSDTKPVCGEPWTTGGAQQDHPEDCVVIITCRRTLRKDGSLQRCRTIGKRQGDE